MRKLLVASQKGGVGKTTTSMNLAAATALAGARVLLVDADPLSSVSQSLNLAQHPKRQPLRQSAVALPGVLVCDVVPGLDIISPYDDGGCSDQDLDQLLRLLATEAFRECYGCLIVNTPPFMGANPAQLLASCDEFVLVMRAEPMAYRTMPAFLELIQRSQDPATPIRMQGILLTLSEGDRPGGRWERELRGRFGTRILPEVIPYDEEVGKSLLFGQVVTQSSPETAAAAQYHVLARSLGLADQAAAGTRTGSPLALAAASLQAAAAGGTRTRERPPAPRDESDKQPRKEVPALVGPEGAAPPVAPSAVRAPADDFTGQARLGWVAVAAVVGVLLRFAPLPDFMLPVIVGTGVSAAVLVLLRLAGRGRPAPHERGSSDRPSGRRPAEGRKTQPRPEGKKGPTRLVALSRRILALTRRDQNGN